MYIGVCLDPFVLSLMFLHVHVGNVFQHISVYSFFLCMHLAFTSSNFSNHDDNNSWYASIGTEDGQPKPVLYSSRQTDKHNYVCQYDSE